MGKAATSKRRKNVATLAADDESMHSIRPSTNETSKAGIGHRQSSQHDGQILSDGPNGSPTLRRSKQHKTKSLNSTSLPKIGQADKSPSKEKEKATNGRSRMQEKTIQSFFNKATQMQQLKSQASPEKSCKNEVNDEDLFNDDISDEEMGMLSQVKSGDEYFFPERRKRKLDDLEDRPTPSSSLPRGSQRFRKTLSRPSSTPNSSMTQVSEIDQRPWTDRFAPINLDELAVHKKKVQNVHNWLESVLRGKDSKSLLILRGPAGSGKTTTLHLVAKELGANIHEWRNSGQFGSAADGYQSVTTQFDEFVARAEIFGTLCLDGIKDEISRISQTAPSNDRKEVILVEEFPNTFSRSSSTLQSFRSSVLQFLTTHTPSVGNLFSNPRSQVGNVIPIVMIISETLLSTSTAAADSFTAFRLLGAEILSHPGVSVIDFNPIAPTFMTKALELVLRKESRKTGRRKAPGPAVLKHLSELGDVRSAISSLEFLCLRGDEFEGWTGKVMFSKPKGGLHKPTPSKLESETLEMVTQRESTLGIFHSVGKVVYNKRELPKATDTPPPQPPSHFPQHVRLKLSEVDVESLLNELGTDIQTFVAALHENYVLSCGSITAEDTLDTVNGCMDSLSDSDILCPDRITNGIRRGLQGSGMDALRQDEISFQICVRGLLFNLPHPVKRAAPPSLGKAAAYQMFYPKSLQLWRRREEIEELLEKSIGRLYQESDHKNTASNMSQAAASGVVETWAKTRKISSNISLVENKGLGDGEENHLSRATLLLALGMSNKLEILLEWLPFAARIRRRKADSNRDQFLKDIETITHITSFATSQAYNEDQQDAEAEIRSDDVWSTDKPAEESVQAYSRTRLSIQMRADVEAVVSKEKAHALVLSDDDIEDD